MAKNKQNESFSMNRDYIDTFLAITRCGSLSAAARELFVDQSTVSHRLINLETGLAVTLFERSRGQRELVLTREGERFYRQAEIWLDLLETMQNIYFQDDRLPLAIGSISSVNLYLIQPLLIQLAQTEHQLRLTVSNHSSEEIYRRLEQRELDIGFAFNPPHYKNLEARPVFKEPMVLLLPYVNDYPPNPVPPTQMERRNEVFFPWNTSDYLEWHDSWWDKRDAPYVTLSTSSLMSMFMEGKDNWSVCPASMAQWLKEKKLADFRSFASPAPQRVIYLLLKPRMKRDANEGVSVFLKRFEDFLATHPWRFSEE